MADAKRTIDLGELRRLALWALAAAGSVALLAASILSGPASDRSAQLPTEAGNPTVALPATRKDKAKPAVAGHAQAPGGEETKRLAETVRALTADRDRLLERIASLERSLEDVTGSIVRAASQPLQAAEPAGPPPVPAAAASVASAEDSAAPAEAQMAAVAPEAAAEAPPAVAVIVDIPPAAAPSADVAAAENPGEETVSPSEFGIDIGRSATIEGLRALWTAARSRHAAQLEGLRPVVFMQKGDRPGRVELRLIVGPVGSAAAAARLCGAMTAAGATCRPEAWDGERLALR
jgi:hypothetical protein